MYQLLDHLEKNQQNKPVSTLEADPMHISEFY